MNENVFNLLYRNVMKMLRENLPQNLFYHCPEHTVDVIQAAERIANSEQCSANDILLIKTAALFHDTGYVRDMREHEKNGCDIATELLAEHHVDPAEIKIICGMIMATKVPQVPKNKLEEIICDADLDYLGRDDYFTIAENLHREFTAFDKVKNEKEWMQLQLNFLQSHSYFTHTSVQQRQPGIAENMKKIREAVVD